ncbi:MAG: GNAT family N-acetyltransferase [Acidobacteriota bacterium]|nr:GNAT family N-acetyltransferase [Acidobacteriota bacterium]
MAAEFTNTSEGQLEAVTALLQHSFHLSSNAPALNPSLLNWKYYEPGPPRPGSRSYVLADKGSLLAHAAIWPIQLRLQGGVRSGIGFCDWAASEEHRGTGLLLLKKLTMLAPFILVIGGADITRQILPRVGFKRWADLPVYARVQRPVRQLLTSPAHNWKAPLRLARNTGWSVAALFPAQAWTAEFSLPDERTLALAHESAGSLNDLDFLKFLLRCPTVPIRCLVLRKNGAPQGYAVLTTVGGQGRIADLRMASLQQEDWNAAISAVVGAFSKERNVCEVSAIASVPLLEQALQANGFHLREHRPLVVLDSAADMTKEPVPQMGMLVDDASFLYNPEAPYLT